MNSTAIARVVAALERVRDAVEQQRAVGQPGERVVERAVAQLVVARAQRVGHLVQLVLGLAQRGREQQVARSTARIAHSWLASAIAAPASCSASMSSSHGERRRRTFISRHNVKRP